VLAWVEPDGPGVRVDSGVAAGSTVSLDYDPLLAKLIVHAEDRPRAIERALRALDELIALGVETNRSLLARVLSSGEFGSGDYDTGIVSRLPPPVPPPVPPAAWIAAALALGDSARDARAALADPWEAAVNWRPGGPPG
jgi:acetyl-CoA/propionyl-CoA carboxylase biotin carboxyl carrier protein